MRNYITLHKHLFNPIIRYKIANFLFTLLIYAISIPINLPNK
ncbi:hypothetical protein HMPREF0476_1296 [Kingella kingae ATCC 23330]|uniref:Uncharacterized protein n=1 Tax=Kingella kingae ATCC 23330 TaxID=887327 RepID=F5S7W3_KINKI|nr:hypothetical protein HMPREF0476_1296 [Kingella kingae ATCC 23330]